MIGIYLVRLFMDLLIVRLHRSVLHKSTYYEQMKERIPQNTADGP